MFSPQPAITSGNMRPGLISGRYPERGDADPGWVDTAFNALQGMLGRMTCEQPSGLHKIAKMIGQESANLSALDNSEFNQRVADLSCELRTQGLTARLCRQAFALVREASARTLGKRHYDVQLMGGWVILQGQLAEMETGQGKTLTATLAAATVALAGIPVHVLTVNEYLVERDAEEMRPLYEALGLTVGFVTQGMTPTESRAAYACDITYCTNKQVAFDYLRDRLLRGDNRSQLRLELESAYSSQSRLGQFMLRGLCFAIIDEADSVLIDEARTPLILTRTVDCAAEHCLYHQVLEVARGLIPDKEFILNAGQHQVRLTTAGQAKLAGMQLADNPFWRIVRRREEVVVQALRALYLLQKDRDYFVHQEKILIVDANTGRSMPDRSWEHGLHQLVESKEGCPLSEAREQLGRLTFQRFFRRYLRLGGMSGTAREVAGELWSVYGLRVRRIPLNTPSRRQQLATRIYPFAHEKWAAVLDTVRDLQSQGRPILIGTGSIAESDLLSRYLENYGIAHQVLNARQDKDEAQIVAFAGHRGQVTVATNMAGRGTDIPLGPGVAEMGGLHVLATYRNSARRVDRQLFGRCARQGDPGSYQAIISVEDELMQLNCYPALLVFLRSRTAKGGRFQQLLNRVVIRIIQDRIERKHRDARRSLLHHDRQTGLQLAFSGPME